MILIFQLVALVFILIMFYFTYLHFRRGEIGPFEAVLLIVVWIGAASITLFPNIIGEFSKSLAISRTFDLAVIGGFIFTIPLVYLSYIRTKRLEKKIEKFIREDAIKQKHEAKK